MPFNDRSHKIQISYKKNISQKFFWFKHNTKKYNSKSYNVNTVKVVGAKQIGLSVNRGKTSIVAHTR